MILVVGTASPGGISQVIKGYQRDGVFEKWDAQWIPTHTEGTLGKRLFTAMVGFTKILRLMLGRKVRLIHAHAAMRGSFWRKTLIVGIARLFRVPVVMHMHGSEMKKFYASQGAIGKKMITSSLEGASRVVVLSQGWADFIGEIAPNARITILPNYSPVFIPHDAGDSATQNRPGKFIFLFLGALIDRKGVFEMLPAFARLTRDFPDVELWMGGTGEGEKVNRMIADLALTNVRLLGWVNETTKRELLGSVDAFILPSKNENLPMAVIEAMSAALPIITTRVGGIPEMLIDGEDGLVIEPADVDLLYEAMRRIRSDRALAQRFATNALRRYEKEFATTVVLPRLDRIYEELTVSRQV